ncbi:MAG TPA: hypothetical protein VN888_01705 [Mycobacterium sp.]|nr:hypothetical protein [Mycobacterium sp.]
MDSAATGDVVVRAGGLCTVSGHQTQRPTMAANDGGISDGTKTVSNNKPGPYPQL